MDGVKMQLREGILAEGADFLKRDPATDLRGFPRSIIYEYRDTVIEALKQYAITNNKDEEEEIRKAGFAKFNIKGDDKYTYITYNRINLSPAELRKDIPFLLDHFDSSNLKDKKYYYECRESVANTYKEYFTIDEDTGDANIEPVALKVCCTQLNWLEDMYRLINNIGNRFSPPHSNKLNECEHMTGSMYAFERQDFTTVTCKICGLSLKLIQPKTSKK
jgi:hypothetical protein